MKTALEGWIHANVDDARVRTVAYSPVLRMFYPDVELPSAIAKADPWTVVYVDDPSEIASILTVASETGQEVSVRQGVGLVSIDVALPFPPGGVVIDLRHLTHIEPAVADGYVDVGASVPLDQLNRTLAPLGYEVPTWVGPATVGGHVAVNMSGHGLDSVTGKPGDHVVGLSAVLGSGQHVNVGTEAQRGMVGPDFTRYLTGSQALFGVVDAVRLRMQPTRHGRVRGWAMLPSMEDAARVTEALYRDGLPRPELMEAADPDFVESSGINSVTEQEGAWLAFSYASHTHADAEYQSECLRRTIEETCQPHSIEVAVADDRWQAAWTRRARPFVHLGAAQYLLGEALDVKVSRLASTLDEVATIQTEMREEHGGLFTCVVSHIGAGTIHPLFGCPAAWSYERRVDVAHTARARILELKLEVGASVSEQGVFPEHADWFRARVGPELDQSFLNMKRVFDPAHILNTSRLHPTSPLDLEVFA